MNILEFAKVHKEIRKNESFYKEFGDEIFFLRANNIVVNDILKFLKTEKKFLKATKSGLQSFITNNKDRDKYNVSIEELTNRVSGEKSSDVKEVTKVEIKAVQVQETKKDNDYNGQEDW